LHTYETDTETTSRVC